METLHNCNYNKVALLHDLKRLSAKIENAYSKDASKAGHPDCGSMLGEIKESLDASAKKLEAAISGVAKEGKFTTFKD